MQELCKIMPKMHKFLKVGCNSDHYSSSNSEFIAVEILFSGSLNPLGRKNACNHLVRLGTEKKVQVDRILPEPHEFRGSTVPCLIRSVCAVGKLQNDCELDGKFR